MSDPLWPHLLDIVSQPAASFLILAGGYGLQLKRQHLGKTGERTLMAEVPETRATVDLDFFLRLEVFSSPQGGDVRQLLDELGYTELVPKFQFVKALGQGRDIKVDLLARRPQAEGVRFRPPRVGQGIGVHGRVTDEAFAVEDSPIRLLLDDTATVWVPHPFPWIVMKTVAAWDWYRAPKPQSEKHAYDVHLLVAMLTERELGECQGFQERYAPALTKIREQARDLFGTEAAPGFLEVARRAGQSVDFATFWEGYAQVLGL